MLNKMRYDLIGGKFNRLKVISLIRNEQNKPFWNCVCECGNTTSVNTSNLISGNTQSCGCLQTESRYLNIGEHKKQNVKTRFFNKVNKLKTGKKCWEWIASIDKQGYGRFGYNYKMIGAHRFSYLKHKGSIPEGFHVCHSCDNRKCVRPSHLFLGTQQDNVDDMIKKGRAYAPGPNKARSRQLTEIKVLDILTKLKKGEILGNLAKQYGVTRDTIRNIKQNKSWKHVPR